MNSTPIEKVIDATKAYTLDDALFPMVFVELEHEHLEAMMFAVEVPSEPRDRGRMYFQFGRGYQRKRNRANRKITGAYEVSPIDFRFSGNVFADILAEKKGVLITSMDIKTRKGQSLLYEVLHPSLETTDMALTTETDCYGVEPQVFLVDAFLAGVRTAKQHQSEASHAYRKVYEAYSRAMATC